jgi:hypothetical protein
MSGSENPLLAAYREAKRDLDESFERLENLIREAHGAVKDLRTAITDARQVETRLPEAANKQIAKAVTLDLERFTSEVNTAIQEATDAAYRRFDAIADVLMGTDPQSVADGLPSIETMVSRIAGTLPTGYRNEMAKRVHDIADLPPAFRPSKDAVASLAHRPRE